MMLANPANALDEIAASAEATRPPEAGLNLFSPRSTAAMALSSISSATLQQQSLFPTQTSAPPQAQPQSTQQHQQPPRDEATPPMQQNQPSQQRSENSNAQIPSPPQGSEGPFTAMIQQQFAPPMQFAPTARPQLHASGMKPMVHFGGGYLPPPNMMQYPQNHHQQQQHQHSMVPPNQQHPSNHHRQHSVVPPHNHSAVKVMPNQRRNHPSAINMMNGPPHSGAPADSLPPWTPPTWTPLQQQRIVMNGPTPTPNNNNGMMMMSAGGGGPTPNHRMMMMNGAPPSGYRTHSVSWEHPPPPMRFPQPHPPMHNAYYPQPQHTTSGNVRPVHPGMAVTPTPHKKQKLPTSSSGSSYGSSSQAYAPQSAPKAPAAEKPKYNRKNKSLGILAESFLTKFTGSDECREIVIDQLATDLAVERRRIYDVVNILEAVQVVVKIGKNTYHWMGREHLSRQFALLQNEGMEQWPEYAVQSGLLDAAPGSGAEQESPSSISNEGNKSLTRLSQLFLQVFLVGLDPVNLPQASDLIHGGRSSQHELVALGIKDGEEFPKDPKKYQQAAARGLKTKIRRLYDIANVFLSVGLLRKSENRAAATTDGKRPYYHWNYGLDVKQIREVWNTMPMHMKDEKSPFNAAQTAVLEKDNNKNYFGLLTMPPAGPIPDSGKASPSSSTCSDESDMNRSVLPDPTGQPAAVAITNSCSSSTSTGSRDFSVGAEDSVDKIVEGSDTFLRHIHQKGGAGALASPRRVSLPKTGEQVGCIM